MAAPPPGAITAKDLEQMDAEARRKLLERNPHLADALKVEGAKAAKPAPAAKAPAGGGGKAARAGAKDRTSRTRPRGAGRRSSSGRRLASRVARETPAIPGPSTTNLVLSFIGTTVVVVGLVLLLGNGRRLEVLPTWLGAAAGRLTDPADPIF